MPRISMAYGPPGERGVATLMSVGTDGAGPRIDWQRAGWWAAGAWAAGVATGNRTLRTGGLVVALVAFGARLVQRP